MAVALCATLVGCTLINQYAHGANVRLDKTHGSRNGDADARRRDADRCSVFARLAQLRAHVSAQQQEHTGEDPAIGAGQHEQRSGRASACGGLRQGCTLSPLFVRWVVEDCIAEARTAWNSQAFGFHLGETPFLMPRRRAIWAAWSTSRSSALEIVRGSDCGTKVQMGASQTRRSGVEAHATGHRGVALAANDGSSF